MSVKERKRRDLALLQAMCLDGTLLSSECAAAPELVGLETPPAGPGEPEPTELRHHSEFRDTPRRRQTHVSGD